MLRIIRHLSLATEYGNYLWMEVLFGLRHLFQINESFYILFKMAVIWQRNNDSGCFDSKDEFFKSNLCNINQITKKGSKYLNRKIFEKRI